MKTMLLLAGRRWAVALALLLTLVCVPTLGRAQANEPKVPVSHLYVVLSDAMGATKAGDPGAASDLLRDLKDELVRIDAHGSEKGRLLAQRLELAIAQPTSDSLASLSNALRAFELEQNPVDHSAKRAEFRRTMAPAYQQLAQAVDRAGAGDISGLSLAYQRFNSAWVGSERVVRNTSIGHYGAIETSLALLRVAIETQPMNLEKVRLQSGLLKQAIDSYNGGATMAASMEKLTLSDGLQLLRDGLSAFESQNPDQGQAKLTRFIEIWPSIEGEVGTRSPDLYARIESQVPVVLAHGGNPAQQAQLQTLINELAQIDPQAQYSAVDAMLILLREGLEAMLIVMALVGALNAARQERGRRWVYGGVLAGLLASVLGALALQRLFPVATAGSNREMVEGVVGVFTVLMMLLVGAWLHSKSSLQSWNAYIRRHMGKALTTGSLVSLAGLSFLSVFREGAETILFYAGILPRIRTGDFLTGIGMAAAILALVAVVLFHSSYKLPIARMFKVLTWVIYALGFKILGVSLHALQLTGHMPLTPLRAPWLDAPTLGLYPTRETLTVQLVYVTAILVIQLMVSRGMRSVAGGSAEAGAVQSPRHESAQHPPVAGT